jgi:hypothetical protein
MRTKLIFIAVFIILSALTAFSGWQSVESPVSDNLRSISFIDHDNVFVSGTNGVILHYDGMQWHQMDSGTNKHLYSISMVTPEEGWAVGTESIILHYHDNQWTEFPLDTQMQMFYHVHALSSDEVYFLSYDVFDVLEGTMIHRWNGAELELLHSFDQNLTGLAVKSPEDIWIAGGRGIVCHYDGVSWDLSWSSIPEDILIFDITLNRHGYPVVTGTLLPKWDIDLIYEYVPGSGWTQLWSGYENRLFSASVNRTRGFAAGGQGRLVEQTIFGWQEISSPITHTINDIVMPVMCEGWAVTDHGGIFRYWEPTIEIMMNQTHFNVGDPFEVNISVRNHGDACWNIMQMILLEVYGVYWFWPSWTDQFDGQVLDLSKGHHDEHTIMTFQWPAEGGPGQSAFWAALLDQDNTILCYDVESFTWSD